MPSCMAFETLQLCNLSDGRSRRFASLRLIGFIIAIIEMRVIDKKVLRNDEKYAVKLNY